MTNITKEVAISYLRWNLYILNCLKANLNNSKGMAEVTIAIGIAIGYIMLSKNENKRAQILIAYQRLIQAFLEKNKQNADSLIEVYNQFLTSLKPFKPKIDQNLKVEESDLDKILNDMANKSNYQA